MTCLDRADDVSRKRKLSTSASFDKDFIAFLQAFDTGCYDSSTDASSLMPDVVSSYASQLAATAAAAAPADMNDLVHGALSADQGVRPAEAAAGATVTMSGEACATQASTQLRMSHSHRAVTTGMPLPHTSSAAATAGAAAAADNNNDDDTASAATLPMPHKRRRTDDEEVTSSPNDLVEVPSATTAVVTTGNNSGPAARRAAAAPAAAAAPSHPASSAQSVETAAAAPAADAAVKAILVSKVLTKSDATSKRIILPRVAVEANLPMLANVTAFHLTATDPRGVAWPLVIKAWANGQNPKPVFVLEQVGEMLKQYKLTVGDAVALMASKDGSSFFMDWNTDEARAAAARPTYSGVTFGSSSSAAGKPKEKKEHGAAAAAAAATTDMAAGSGRTAAAAVAAAAGKPPVPPQQPKQRQQPEQQQFLEQKPHVRQLQQQLQLPTVVPFAQQQQQQPASSLLQQPLMTAVPVNRTPFVSGTFIPTSPCQLLVMGDGGAAPYFKLEEPAPSLLSSMLVTRSDAAMELPEADVLLMATARGGEEGADGLLSGTYLLCLRTPGCSRPAGHQGWCLGHKGYKKKKC